MYAIVFTIPSTIDSSIRDAYDAYTDITLTRSKKISGVKGEPEPVIQNNVLDETLVRAGQGDAKVLNDHQEHEHVDSLFLDGLDSVPNPLVHVLQPS